METNDSKANENERIVREALSKLNEHFQGSCRLVIRHLEYGRFAYYHASLYTIYFSPRAIRLPILAHEYAHYLCHMRLQYKFYIKSMKKDIRTLKNIIKTTQKSIKQWNFSTNQNPVNIFGREKVGQWIHRLVSFKKNGKRHIYHDDEFALCLYEVIKFLYNGNINRYFQESESICVFECVKVKKKLFELAEKDKSSSEMSEVKNEQECKEDGKSNNSITAL
jgi:hypothetical protein